MLRVNPVLWEFFLLRKDFDGIIANVHQATTKWMVERTRQAPLRFSLALSSRRVTQDDYHACALAGSTVRLVGLTFDWGRSQP